MIPIAISVAKVAGADTTVSNKRVRVRTITFDTSYPTGGYSVTLAQAGMRKSIEFVKFGAVPATAGGATARLAAYDYVNSKILLYTTASTEAVAATDQSAFSVRVQFWGS